MEYSMHVLAPDESVMCPKCAMRLQSDTMWGTDLFHLEEYGCERCMRELWLVRFFPHTDGAKREALLTEMGQEVDVLLGPDLDE